MLDQLLKSLVGADDDPKTVEERFLHMISLLDRVETLQHVLVASELIPVSTGLKIAEAKQELIEAFATANRKQTLDLIKAQYAEL